MYTIDRENFTVKIISRMRPTVNIYNTRIKHFTQKNFEDRTKPRKFINTKIFYANYFYHENFLIYGTRVDASSGLADTCTVYAQSSLVPRPHPKNRERGLVSLANFPVCAESAYYVTITYLT